MKARWVVWYRIGDQEVELIEVDAADDKAAAAKVSAMFNDVDVMVVRLKVAS